MTTIRVGSPLTDEVATVRERVDGWTIECTCGATIGFELQPLAAEGAAFEVAHAHVVRHVRTAQNVEAEAAIEA